MPQDAIPGTYRERVDAAGGIDEYQAKKAKEREEAIARIEKIPEEKWKQINSALDKIGDFLVNPLESSIGGMLDSFKENITLQFEQALAPLQNELNSAINTALAPLMPFITDTINNLAGLFNTGFRFLEAVFTGKLDQFLVDIRVEFADEVHADHVERTEGFWGSDMGEWVFQQLYGISMADLSDTGTGGGVNSGQYDIDYATIDQILGIREEQQDTTDPGTDTHGVVQ